MIKGIRYLKNTLRAVKSYKKGVLQIENPPLILWIEPTSHCDLKCPMCPTSYKDVRKGYMDIELFKKIVDEIHTFVLEVFLVQGGESLLHNDLPEMIEYLNQKDIYPILTTNANSLNTALAEKLLETDIQMLTFSFDGYDRETYESIRKGADFENVIGNIKSFLKIKKEKNRKRPYIIIESIVNSKKDQRFTGGKREEFKKRFRGLPVGEFSTRLVTNYGQNPAIYDDTYDIQNLQSVFKRQKEAGEINFHPCPRPWTTVSVLQDGRVVPCCIDLFGEIPLGNVKDKEIIEIWNDSPMKKLRKKHLKKDLKEVPLCNKCGVPFSSNCFGIPKDFYGIPSALRWILGPSLYRKLFNAGKKLLGFRSVTSYFGES